ncbi:WD repeat-containing protein 75 [Ceratitis capitata]|uniref:WD repeat-containing protein 75 n=1 Tax=Ceratitis capitata TaxID=7213 RepID=UPI000329DB2E|nr:WD repeat-containing protein 75 [Ceratitis capitata]
MVCRQQVVPENNTPAQRCNTNKQDTTPMFIDNFIAKTRYIHTDLSEFGNISNMDFEELDKLKLQYLAGANLVEHTPLYAPGGEFLFIRCKNVIYVYSTVTGELARKLTGASANIVSMELELHDNETLVACSSNGEVFRWIWRFGRQQQKLELNLHKAQEILTFNLINLYANSNTACAFVTAGNEQQVQWFVVDTSTGERLNVPCKLELLPTKPLVSADSKNFKHIAIVQGYYVYFLNYKTWAWKRLFNARRIPITVVRCHPLEEAIITGDEIGQIFLWREFMSQSTVKTTLYHWHHTAVTSIAFTPSGTGFYSSGHESVLVYWNIQQPDLRNFLPRMGSVICQLAANDDNTQIAVCTADNGVHFVGSDNEIVSTLQEFTYMEKDKTGNNKFPVGLRLNPRTNTIVLNGKHGHLQFYSVYTKNMLYNMDIVMQNQLSMESAKVLYNIMVTKAAFNIDWMATGEVFNDYEHLPELRLKFWKYDEAAKTYSLNTNVELPHEGGFKAIEFSTPNQVDNLLCATVGEDNIIKMWSLEESDSIYKKGKAWYCIAKTSYRGLPVESISFSQDGSVLAAGYGNTLCIYRAENLKLKAALTPPPGFDGVVPTIQVSLRQKGVESQLKDDFTPERRKRWLQLLNDFIGKNDETLIKELEKFAEKCEKIDFKPKEVSAEDIDEETRKKLYNKIMDMHQLNFFHKVLLFQRLGIRVNVHPEGKERLLSYLYDTIIPEGQRNRLLEMENEVKHISTRYRYKAKWRLHEYEKRLKRYEAQVQEKLLPLMEALDFGDASSTPLTNGNSAHKSGASITPEKAEKSIEQLEDNEEPLEEITLSDPVMAQIKKVQFAAGEWAHLVIVCTERRVLIYNLLTLRLHAACKLSVEHMAFDPISNLVAAFTKYNELYVFQPNVPLPIYQRRNLPRLYDAVWLPRRHPKNRSINVDWQAQSTLYFLTEDQEIYYLGIPDSVDDDAPPPITFTNPVKQAMQYSTFGTFATQQHSDMQSSTRQSIGPLVVGNSSKTAVKSLIDMSTHTMPPLSLLAADFVKSLLKTADSSAKDADANKGETFEKSGKPLYNRRKMLNGGSRAFMNGHGAEHSDDDETEEEEEEEQKHAEKESMNGNNTKHAVAMDADIEMVDEALELKKRKSLILKNEEISANAAKTAATQRQDNEAQLKRIAVASVELEF